MSFLLCMIASINKSIHLAKWKTLHCVYVIIIIVSAMFSSHEWRASTHSVEGVELYPFSQPTQLHLVSLISAVVSVAVSSAQNMYFCVGDETLNSLPSDFFSRCLGHKTHGESPELS